MKVKNIIFVVILSSLVTACSGNSGTESMSSFSNETTLQNSEEEAASQETQDEKDGNASENSAPEPVLQNEVEPEVHAGYEAVGGTWKVQGIYYKGYLIDINDNDAIRSMYDTTMITFNEDGSFVYLKKFNDRGTWSKKSDITDSQFILKTESTFTYVLENGSLAEKETESDDKKTYIAELADENTLILNEFDPITGKAKMKEDPYIFVREGEESSYIAENKTPVGNGGSSESSKPSGGETSTKPEASAGGSATSGERNALSRALDYLDYTAFSYTSLIEQLEFEGYTHSEAVYAADHCGADWNEQAVKKAKEYLEYTSFSRSGLIDQLVFEGFTQAQAEYGVDVAY